MTGERKILDGVYPRQVTILAAIRAMQHEMQKENRIEEKAVESRRLNDLRKIYFRRSTP